MCIACVFPKGTTLTESEFESSWENNHDGGGYTYIDENGVMVTKKFLKYDDFINSWKVDDQAVREYSPRLLHFRATSRGAISVENCHPFSINPTVALIHNGTIAGIPVDKEKSDTRLFSEMLAGLPDNFYTNQSVITLIDGFIGMNKVALMTNYGEFVIFNKQTWVEDNNRIFSNQDFKFRRQQAQGMFPHQVAKWEHNVKEKDAGKLECKFCFGKYPYKDWDTRYVCCKPCGKVLEGYAGQAKINPHQFKGIYEKIYEHHNIQGLAVKPEKSIIDDCAVEFPYGYLAEAYY